MSGRDQDVGHHRAAPMFAEGQPGAWIVAAQFGEHFGKVLRIDLAQLMQAGDLAARDQFQIVDQPRHARIVAIRLARLDRETFSQIARADPCGIERLDELQCALRFGERNVQRIGDLAQRLGEVACFVEPFDQRAGDEYLAVVTPGSADLRVEIFGQRQRGAAVAVDGETVILAAEALRCTPAAVARVAVDLHLGGGKVGRRVALGSALRDQRIRVAFLARGFGRVAVAILVTLAGIAARRNFAHFEQRVGLQRIADKRFDLEIGQRQQLDRLLQLRRHHQRLRLAQVEARVAWVKGNRLGLAGRTPATRGHFASRRKIKE